MHLELPLPLLIVTKFPLPTIVGSMYWWQKLWGFVQFMPSITMVEEPKYLKGCLLPSKPLNGLFTKTLTYWSGMYVGMIILSNMWKSTPGYIVCFPLEFHTSISGKTPGRVVNGTTGLSGPPGPYFTQVYAEFMPTSIRPPY